MIGTIVTPMARGQITIPKEIRDKLGIKPGTPLNVTLEVNKIVVQPLKQLLNNMTPGETVKPKLSPVEYVRRLQGIKGVWWTKADDIKLIKLAAKEKRPDW